MCVGVKNNEDPANKYYEHFISSEVFHNFQNNFLLTDGIFEVAGEEACFWFLKKIADAQILFESHSSQHWSLKRIAQKQFKIEATDLNGLLIFEEKIFQCNFYFNELVIYVVDSLIMLPSEYLSATRSQLKITAGPHCLRYQLVNIDISKQDYVTAH